MRPSFVGMAPALTPGRWYQCRPAAASPAKWPYTTAAARVAQEVHGRDAVDDLRARGLRRAWGPGWALVGDAGYFRDPLTAHGLTDDLRDAERLARAVAAGTDAALAAFQAARDEDAHAVFELTERIASLAGDVEQVRRDYLLLMRHVAREAERLALVPPRGGPREPHAAPRVHPAAAREVGGVRAIRA